MSQATTSTFPTPLPTNTDHNDYPPQHVPRGHQQPISKPAVSAFSGAVDCWAPSSQGAMPVFPFVGNTPSADTVGSSLELLGYDGTFSDPSLPNNGLLNFQFRPYLDPFIEEPEPTTAMPDAKFDPNSVQLGPQPRPALSYPFGPVPLEKPALDSNLLSSRAAIGHRRSSAPGLNVRDLERERTQKLKHQNRRASHNVVEKRYRENLNRKFHLLETIVNKGTEPYSCSPCSSPRSSPSSSGSRKGNTSFSSSSSSSARRQYTSPKATIIDSALNYIESLRSENHALKGRLVLYETSNNPCLSGRPQGQLETGVQGYDQGGGSGGDSSDGDEEMSSVKSEERQ